MTQFQMCLKATDKQTRAKVILCQIICGLSWHFYTYIMTNCAWKAHGFCLIIISLKRFFHASILLMENAHGTFGHDIYIQFFWFIVAFFWSIKLKCFEGQDRKFYNIQLLHKTLCSNCYIIWPFILHKKREAGFVHYSE